ncbi:MAG: hypothetical protein R2716_06285 [Microthrixaceae bacterium]
MLHARLTIHRLEVDGTETSVALATLMAVRRDSSPDLQWEVVAQTLGAEPPVLGTNELGLVVVSGADAQGVPLLSQLCGRAVVVRYVDSTVVWRGDGPLAGFDETWLG